MVKALDLSSNGCVVRVGSNPTPGKNVIFKRVSLIMLYFSMPTCRHWAFCNCAWIVSLAFSCFALQLFAFLSIIIALPLARRTSHKLYRN